MHKFSNPKGFDLSSIKNIEENEIRTEMENITANEFEYLSNKNIHNKGKEYK